jgi:hypothetical protein
LASSGANIDREYPCLLDMGMEVEYQDPAEVWSDLESDGDGFLSLSSDEDNRSDPQFEHLGMDLSDDDVSLVIPQTPSAGSNRYRLPLIWDDVKMDLDDSHAHGSPDAPVFHSRIESLSPPAASAAYVSRPGTGEARFPGLSTKHCQEDEHPDIELCFDSDLDSPHGLDEDVTAHLRHARDVPEEHQPRVGNGSGISTEVGTKIDEVGEELYFGLEDW